jgi:hypothetical protein
LAVTGLADRQAVNAKTKVTVTRAFRHLGKRRGKLVRSDFDKKEKMS